MSKDSFSAHAALAFIVSSTVDAALFAVLGGSQHTRATLKTMVDPIASPISDCQARLCDFLNHFADAEEPSKFASRWRLLSYCSGAVANKVEFRMETRKVLLQLSAGILDVTELRWCKPPYTLAVLARAEASEESKKACWSELAWRSKTQLTLCDSHAVPFSTTWWARGGYMLLMCAIDSVF